MSRAEGARREKAVDRKETPAPPAPGWLAWRRCRVSDAPAEELRWAHRWALVQLRNRSLDETTRRVAWARLILEEARGVSSAEPGPDPTVLDLALPHGLPARAAGDLETLRRAYRAEAMGKAKARMSHQTSAARPEAPESAGLSSVGRPRRSAATPVASSGRKDPRLPAPPAARDEVW